MENFFDSRDAASIAAAERIARALERRLDAQGEASVVVSGGTSPAGVFAQLAGVSLAWPDVHVILSDERWVPSDHEDSNEKLVRETLLTGEAQRANLLTVLRARRDDRGTLQRAERRDPPGAVPVRVRVARHG